MELTVMRNIGKNRKETSVYWYLFRRRFNINRQFYNHDTPLTVGYEMKILKESGFTDVRILKNWSATYTIKAER